MSIKTPAGLQDSGTADESDAENIETDLEFPELINQHEDTEWSEVIGISAAEAGTPTVPLTEERETLQEGL